MWYQRLNLNGQLKENKMDKDFYKSLDLPLIAAPLFLISGPEMVIECCKNGIVGTFPALNQRTTEGFEGWVVQIKDALELFEKETGKKAAPFGVNLIVHPTNIRVKADLDVCEKHKVPIIITSLRAPKFVTEAVHSYGGVVMHDVINIRHAKKIIVMHEGKIDELGTHEELYNLKGRYFSLLNNHKDEIG